MKGKGRWHEAIIGIVLAGIMLALVLAVMVPMVSTESRGDSFNYIQKQTAPQKVLIGQILQFEGFRAPPTVYRLVDGDIENAYYADSDNRIYNVNWPTSGAFYVNYQSATDYDAQLSVEGPNMPLKLKVGTKRVSSIAVGTDLIIDTGGMNLFPEDQVDLIVIGPDGQIKHDEENDQQFTDITVAELRSNFGGTPNNLETAGWTIGDYTFQIETKPEYACGLEAESAVRDLKIIKGEITIDAERTSTVERETVILTVTGVAGDKIKVKSSPLSENVLFQEGVDDTPTGADFHGNWFTDAIDEDGIRKYAVKFDDTGTFTIWVTVGSTEPIRVGDYDTEDIMVLPEAVEFNQTPLPPLSPEEADKAEYLKVNYPKFETFLAELIEMIKTEGLAQAESYAYQSGVEFINGSIYLILELEPGAPVPTAEIIMLGGEIHLSALNKTAITIPLANMGGLTSIPTVRFIHLPVEGTLLQRIIISEGADLIGALQWHTKDNKGAGIKVAIIDGSFDNYLLRSGVELPPIGPRLITRSFRADGRMQAGSVHGTACAEIVHDIAPEATLYLVAIQTPTDLNAAITWLIQQDVDVISMSLGWENKPFDDTSDVAREINRAWTNGIFNAVAAGNEQNNHYEGTFTDNDIDRWHEFAPNDEAIWYRLAAKRTYTFTLSWSDWPVSNQDYDLYLLDGANNVVARSTGLQNGIQEPVEIITYTPRVAGNYFLAVRNFAANLNLHLEVYSNRAPNAASDNLVRASSLSSPGDARGAKTVGAIHWRSWAVGPEEVFSSRGPTNDGRIKPDIMGPDGVSTQSYGASNGLPFGAWGTGFFGTSAATPHVGGAAALVMSCFGVNNVQARQWLDAQAIDMGVLGKDNTFGDGRLNLLSKIPEKEVTFDMPSTVVICDRVTIKGTATSGTHVDVYVDDTLYKKLDDLVIEDGEFSKEVITTDVGMDVPGSVRLKAWIDCDKAAGEDRPTRSPDGEDAILLTNPSLSAELSVPVVALEDDFKVEGTAKGQTEVVILSVPPKGGGGKSLLDKGEKGLSPRKASVSMMDGTFSKKMTVQEDATTGYYDIYVLCTGCSGMDGEWGMTGEEDLEAALDERYGIPSLTTGIINTKTQEEIDAILEDLIYGAGSDDLMVKLRLKVEMAYVTLDPVADVAVGELLVVTGKSNRQEGYVIVVTCTGPVELAPKTVKIENGTFRATFDTTGAREGEYTVKADDGDGHTDDVKVDITGSSAAI